MCTHHLIAEEPPESEPIRASAEELRARYTNAEGMIVQCCHCRMTRRRDDRHTWDWVPSFVERQPDNLSHGLCQPCFRLHYPILAARWDAAQRVSGTSSVPP
jgi:hypothetical protein